MIELGCCDAGVATAERDAYLKKVEQTTRLRLSEVADSSDRIKLHGHAPDAQQPMTVADMQRGLAAAGFYPGGNLDGICGYRTLAAMRLFQEYVRSREKQPIVPDGRFGPISQKHLKRWVDDNLATEWAPTIARWRAGTLQGTEYAAWLALLEAVKTHYTANPTPMLQKVNAFNGASDTKKIAGWNFASAGNVHLIGIRRSEASGKFDDVFVLLVKGLVFKFQGTTEPGASENPLGAPFLVHGQHDYHFGWHQRRYLALRPQGTGVLVVRSKGDLRLDDVDVGRGLEANATINIHWGGKGLKFDVKNWSEGCQVVNGSLYLDEKNTLVDCTAFAAANNGEVAANPLKTRAAYNVLADLVTALAGDLPGGSVKYTLLAEQDLDLAPALRQGLADSRKKVAERLA
jgi:hypothetical protein